MATSFLRWQRGEQRQARGAQTFAFVLISYRTVKGGWGVETKASADRVMMGKSPAVVAVGPTFWVVEAIVRGGVAINARRNSQKIHPVPQRRNFGEELRLFESTENSSWFTSDGKNQMV